MRLDAVMKNYPVKYRQRVIYRRLGIGREKISRFFRVTKRIQSKMKSAFDIGRLAFDANHQAVGVGRRYFQAIGAGEIQNPGIIFRRRTKPRRKFRRGQPAMKIRAGRIIKLAQTIGETGGIS
jgi:hypothetical protein